MKTASRDSKKIIVVLGAGRSGTSILMQILEALGMTTSADMIPAKEHNPCGAYEDSDIFWLQEDLLKQTTPDSMPPAVGWINNKGTQRIKAEIKNIVKKRIQDTTTVFGFKDPRTALFIPLWIQIFNELNITPLYILATRKPETVIQSKVRQFNANEIVTELFWLTKNTEALYQTGGNCLIVHYEDWFTDRAPEIAKQLLKYTGLDSFFDENRRMPDVLAEVVKPNLNRAVYNDYEVKNRYVLKLQQQLELCRGNQFDHQGLMDVVIECRRAMEEFSGWAIEAQRCFLQRGNTNKSKGSSKRKGFVEHNMYKMDLEQSVLEANKYLQKCKDLGEQNENLRIKISMQAKEYKAFVVRNQQELEESQQELKRKNRQIQRKEKKIFTLQSSTSFQVGQILVNAVANPGKNTILFPFYLLRTALASRVVKT